MALQHPHPQPQDFLRILQREAKWQRALQTERWIPAPLGKFSSFFVEHSWQFLLVMAFISTIFWEVFYWYVKTQRF